MDMKQTENLENYEKAQKERAFKKLSESYILGTTSITEIFI